MTDDYLGLLLGYSCILFFKLISALGNPLFQRTPRRMVPTEAGQRLYTEIAGARRNSNQFRTKTQPPKLHKPSESVRPKNFLPIDFWVNYQRTIALFTLYNLG
jgi:hypothetical protein